MLWTEKELKILKAYEHHFNELAMYPDWGLPENLERYVLYLQGYLYIINKYVILCRGSEKIGILKFREAIDTITSKYDNGYLLTYFPINFKSNKQFVEFLQ